MLQIILIVWFSIGLVVAILMAALGMHGARVYNVRAKAEIIKNTLIGFFLGPIVVLVTLIKLRINKKYE